MFERFRVDREQTRDYILSVTGFDVPSHILGYLCENGTDYNFLTPRSLTKLCVWMSFVYDTLLVLKPSQLSTSLSSLIFLDLLSFKTSLHITQ